MSCEEVPFTLLDIGAVEAESDVLMLSPGLLEDHPLHQFRRPKGFHGIEKLRLSHPVHPRISPGVHRKERDRGPCVHVLKGVDGPDGGIITMGEHWT